MATLYRDYRPQNFAEVLGQQHIKITLQNEISAGKIAQAFLFCGPRAVGKTTLARVLAKAVNCEKRKAGDYEPCGQCDNCLSITAGSNLDVVEIDAASNTGVDNVRENIISFSRLAPAKANYKVFIIDEVHMLSSSAFNALLKIIEEPPAHVIFILCTTEIHKVPATVVSRCERFDFKRIGVTEVTGKLRRIATAEKIEIDDDVLEAVARQSGGHLRDAESLLGQIFSLGEKRITLEQAGLVMPHYNSSQAVDFIDKLARKDAAGALNLVNALVDSGVNIRNFTAEAISLIRKMIIAKISPELSDSLGLNLGESLELKINETSKIVTLDRLVFLARRLLAAHSDKNQLITQLPLELAAIEVCTSAVPSMQGTQNPQATPPRANPGLSSTSRPTHIPPSVSGSADFQAAARITLADQKNEEPLMALQEEAPIESGSASAKTNLSQEQVLEKWPEFLIKIKKYNHSLSFVLQNCEPEGVSAGCLKLAFKYKFHQDRINDASIKDLIEKTLAEVFGGRLMINSRLDENLEFKRQSAVTETDAMAQVPAAASPEKSPSTPAPLMDSLLQAFGGEVIS